MSLVGEKINSLQESGKVDDKNMKKKVMREMIRAVRRKERNERRKERIETRKKKEVIHQIPSQLLSKFPDDVVKYLVLKDGFYIPKSALSSHQKIPIFGKLFKNLQATLLQTLKVFHSFAEQHDILYSLHGGSLMGYYWHGKMIPWDDDIDLIVREKDLVKINKIWMRGKIGNFQRYSRGYDNRLTRIITIDGSKYELIKSVPQPNSIKVLYKLRPINNNCFVNVPGGVDIISCVVQNGKKIDGWSPHRIAAGPVDSDTEEKFPIVDFNGIKTRAILREYGEPFLDQVYSKKWRIKCHPLIKYPKKHIL